MDKFKAPALAKGLDIIDLIRDNGCMSFNEIQEKTSDNPASLSRYLQTLIAKKYIHKNSNQKYELGLKLIELSDSGSIWTKLLTCCRPVMAEINKKYNITLLLLVYSNKNYVVIEKFIAPDNLGMMPKNFVGINDFNTIWSNQFYHKNVDEKIRAYEHSKLKDSNTNFENQELKEFVENIKENGYMNYYKPDQAILRMGFPIYYKGNVVAIIGLGSFINQLSEKHIGTIKSFIFDQIQYIQKSIEEN